MTQMATLRRSIVALASLVAMTMAAPGAAQAAFTSPYTQQCSGGPAEGGGSGLQTKIAQVWTAQFNSADITSPLACAAYRNPEVSYRPSNSSSGLEAFGALNGVRNLEHPFVGIDEPPTLSQWLRIDEGDKPGSDSGLVRQIPTASTAVTILINFPSACGIPSGEATTDGRFTVSNSQLEKAFAGDPSVATWGQLLPDISPSCANEPISRVVPSESDGPAYVVKQWLNTINPSRGWLESSSNTNTTWPNDTGATATVRSGSGDRSEIRAVAATDGSIGFGGLPIARELGFGYFSPSNPHNQFAGDRFWLSVQNGSGQRVEPTRDPLSSADEVRGANCDSPTFNYVPNGYDTTITPVWRYVSAAGSKTGWPICTLTYDLAWDDASTADGNTENAEALQRSVKDYLAYVLGAAGQAEAHAADYSALPATLLADARYGQERVGWNKVPGSKSNIKAHIAAALYSQP